MTFHLTGGVKLTTLKQEFATWIKQSVSQLTLVGVMLAMVPTGVIAAPVAAASATARLAYDAAASRIAFDTADAGPLDLIPFKPVDIAIGESRAQEAARLEAEAAARAAAMEAARQAALRAATTKNMATIAAPRSPEPDLAGKRALVQQAAATYGIPWEILEAVWQVESGKAWHTGVRSSAGAQGPAQFIPATWRRYGVDGNGDGVKDVTRAEDAIYGAANYLAANGAGRGEIYNSLFAYNHADWYVQKVLKVAREIGYVG